MLVNLHVKNFAIIDEIDVDFNKHLNILTGETGAGKSILVGSVNIALGQRVSAEMIRKGADYAMVELVFQIEDEETIHELKSMDIYPEDGQIVISRKIMENRSVNKINGESVPVATIKAVAALCIDIHGQHEHQSLLDKRKHLDIIDDYMREELAAPKAKLKTIYQEYRGLKKEWQEAKIPEEERQKQISFLEYEKNEIENVRLKEGEEESLEKEYKKLSSAGTVVEALTDVYQMSGDTAQGAGRMISQAIRQMAAVSDFDEETEAMFEQLSELEDILSGFNRSLSSYMDGFTFEEGRLREVEERLDTVRGIFARYGGNYEKVVQYLEEVCQKLDKFVDYDNFIGKLEAEIAQKEKILFALCSEISAVRKKGANILSEQISSALGDLNFADARFQVMHRELTDFSENGKDEMEFMIATNPGEDLKPLAKIASGGELSRIMLAVKSVFADSDRIETLIFDEIDVGISGRTAQKVAEKMAVLGNAHQIICITHLAQIAAMADTHYMIEKEVEGGKTRTCIRPLKEDESVQELARILSGAEITDAVMASAAEMKELALKCKNYAFKN